MATRSQAPAGALLREWRAARRISQLTLSLQTGVSSRHLSYLETGRSQPSREMVLRLAEALDVPLRHRNELLVAAGYAPRYFESDLDASAMAAVRRAIDLILQHQEPYPAFVLDRHWNIRMANRAAERCTRFLLGRDPDEANIVRLLLHPDGLRDVLLSWDETAGDLVRHLRAQVAAAPGDGAAAGLLEEVLSYPGIRREAAAAEPGVRPEPLLTTVFRRDDVELRLFSTFTTFGTPRDVTLDELRIECSFPADDATAEACRRLFAD